MAAIINAAVRLLFLSYMIRSCVHAIFALQSFGIRYSCERDVVCFHIWQFGTEETADYISIVSNGEIQTAPALQDEDSKCAWQLKQITAKSVGRHSCRRRPIFLPSYNTVSTSSQINFTPGKIVSLQCVLLTYVQQGYCHSLLQQQVSLVWVNETGDAIQQDSQHRIDQKSACDVTLTVTFQKPEKKYRCQATVDEQVLTSVEFDVGLPAPEGRRKGRGRIMNEREPESQGGNQDTAGLAVGLVGCAVLSAVVAVFVVNKRRSQQQPKESHYTINTDDVVNADDVIYTDIMLPVGSDRVLVHECESSEYASVRYR